jgi:hypothetical protein
MAMDHSDQPVEARDAASRGEAPRLSYHRPVLRSHGRLRDVTAQYSGSRSDVNLKENIVAVVWS